MKIQELTVRDVDTFRDSIYELLQIDFQSTYGYQANSDFVFSKIDAIPQYIEDNSAVLYAAVDAKGMCGFIWAYPVATPFETVLHIAYIAISPQARNKGIGTKLIRRVEEEAKKRGHNRIELVVASQNYSARSFYEKNGYAKDRIYMIKEV